MKVAIPTFYASYGRYINRFRAIPYYIDALKPVERRLLLSLLKAKTNQKSAYVIGHCIGTYHPHGDECFPGDTKVYSLDGNTYTFEELANSNKEIEVLAFDTNTNKIVPAKAKHFRKTKTVNKLYKIHLSNGTAIQATDNHPFYVIDKGFVRADELKCGDKILSGVVTDNFNKDKTQVTGIEIIKYANKVDVYDFTVLEYENMFIVSGQEDNYTYLICAHNSTYKALVQLVHRGFAEGQGNWGSPGLEDEYKAAAYRYTEIKRNEYLSNLFNEFLPFAEYETLELNLEPLYLPCPVPIGLIGSSITTGISFYTTKVPQYLFADLVKRMKYLIERQNGVEPKDEPVIEPNIQGCDVYEDQPGEFKRILTDGEGIIQVIPQSELDLKNNCVIIKGKVPTERGGFSKLKKSQAQMGIRIVDASNAKVGYRIIVEPATRKKVNPDFELDVLRLVSAKIKIQCNLVDDTGAVQKYGIDEVLMNNYNKWLQCYKSDRQDQLRKTQQKLYEVGVIEIIRKILEENPAVKKVGEIIDIYNKNKKYQTKKVSDDSIRQVCSKKSIQKLIEHKLDKQRIQTRINELEDEINHIAEFGYKRLESLV